MQRQALNAVDTGASNERIVLLRQKVAAQPDTPKPRLELAEEYARAGFAELELEHLRLAAERFPSDDSALVALGRALVRSQRNVEAARRLMTYVAANDKASAAAFSWTGIAFDGAGQWKDGEKMHLRAVEKASGQDTLHNNLGYNLFMQGRKLEAAERFRRALELNPASETARNNLGLALADQPAAAIAEFRRNADLAVAHNNLAAYLYERGDLPGARRELELALSYRKDVPQIFDNLRRLSEHDGKPIVLPAEPQKTFWKVFARGLKQTFVSGEQRNSTGIVETAR